MNPPFNDASDRKTPDALKAEAHAMTDGLFDIWFRTAGAIMKPGGQLSLIARPESIAGIIVAPAGAASAASRSHRLACRGRAKTRCASSLPAIKQSRKPAWRCARRSMMHEEDHALIRRMRGRSEQWPRGLSPQAMIFTAAGIAFATPMIQCTTTIWIAACLRS